MSNLEIVVATMNQKDFSLIEKMNIHSDVIFANQTDVNEYTEMNTDELTARMISTTTRGVGVNRNLGLAFSRGDILLFADDDFVYNDDMHKKVLKAFEELPKADVIIFGNHYTLGGKVYKTRSCKTGKLPLYKSMKYGTCVIAARKKKLQAARISFIEVFGGGCLYCNGEDSDFILNCYRKHLKLYTYDYILGSTAKDSTTCFPGYNGKYFYDTGALAKSSFGILKHFYMIYVLIRTRKVSEIKTMQMIKHMIAGYRNYNKQITYKEWMECNK